MRLVGPSTRIRNTKKGKVPLGQEVINKFFYISLIDHENTLCIQMNIWMYDCGTIRKDVGIKYISQKYYHN